MKYRLQKPRCVVYGPDPNFPTKTPLTVRIEQIGEIPDDVNMYMYEHWFAF